MTAASSSEDETFVLRRDLIILSVPDTSSFHRTSFAAFPTKSSKCEASSVIEDGSVEWSERDKLEDSDDM